VSSFLLCIQIQVPVEFRRHSTYIQINFPNLINTELNVVFSFMFSGTGTAPEDFGDPGSGAAETTTIDSDRFHIPDHRSGSDSCRGQIPRSQRRAALLS